MARETTRVLITGAQGNLGNKLRRHLESRGNYGLVLLDIDPKDDAAVFRVDLSRYDQTWANLFSNQDAIVHLAAEPRQQAPWPSLERSNVVTAINVYEAAVASKAKRVIFASSNVTMSGYLDSDSGIKLDTRMPAWPVNYYGATKLMGESMGKSYADRHGLSVICLRIGWVAPGENRPDPDTSKFKNQQTWLSNRDLCQGIEKAITVEGVEYAVLNLMSNNQDMPWDLTETSRILGYRPDDGIIPKPPSYASRWRILYKRISRRINRQRQQTKAPT